MSAARGGEMAEAERDARGGIWDHFNWFVRVADQDADHDLRTICQHSAPLHAALLELDRLRPLREAATELRDALLEWDASQEPRDFRREGVARKRRAAAYRALWAALALAAEERRA
jgi:hypothetical protein